MVNKIKTDVSNAKWHTLWKKRMTENKPREGDYNFIIWKREAEIIVDPFDMTAPPSIFKDGAWVSLAEGYADLKSKEVEET
jgi:hypothetical protein